MLEYIILGFLHYSDMSGYDIKRSMEHSIAYFYDASFGSIYPMLKKMEVQGTVTMTETTEGGKLRKEYAITDTGRTAFAAWLEQPITLNRARHDHLVRIFFYRLLPLDRAMALIRDFISVAHREYHDLTALKGRIDARAGVFELATLDYGLEYYQFTTRWCEEFLKNLEQQDNEGKEDRT